jgi:hypothetical protein
VFREILDICLNSHLFQTEDDVKNIFTRKLDLPDNYDMIILEKLFNEYQLYGEKLSFAKNLLEEKVGEAKFACDTAKTRYDIAKKQAFVNKIDDQQLQGANDQYKKFHEIHRTWKFFHNVLKDKWELLNKTFNHIRGCISTERTMLQKGISHGTN